jgi:hypothetical protein
MSFTDPIFCAWVAIVRRITWKFSFGIPRSSLGFSSFINANLLQRFRESYEEMFPGCEIQLAGGDPVLILQRLNQALGSNCMALSHSLAPA